MKKILIALALPLVAAAAAPAMAEDAPQKVQFNYEGVTYTYTKTQLGKSTIYKGYATPGDAFFFVARDGQVTGKANGGRVSFKVPAADAQAAADSKVQVAAR